MEIIVGKLSGFCSGVEYTVISAYKELEHSNNSIYCLGEIVHNERVIEDLKTKGMIFVQNIDDVPNNSKVIFRAHGERKEIYGKAKEKNIEVIDLTCGKIRVIRNKIQRMLDDSFIIIIGKKNHPETVGTISYCGEKCFVVENEFDINDAFQKFKLSNLSKVYVVSQTTFSMYEFDKLSDMLKKQFSDAETIIDCTICDATEKRQQETIELSKVTDIMIIIGGRNSSNTKELANLAMQHCKEVYLIQSVDDLEGKIFDKDSKIGIMAGASTPKVSLDEVVDYLNKM